MNNWRTWKIKYKKQIDHVVGYEEAFVEKILSQIPEISPADVVPQFHFIDDNGGNRYIDFMIVNESKGYFLPIELDGTYKDINHQRWKDFLVRQNSLITKFGMVLRFSNKQMIWESSEVVAKIRQTLHLQSTNKITEESKVRERERLMEWYEKKINELERSSHNHKSIEDEINQLRTLVEEIRAPQQQAPTKELVTNQKVSGSKSSFWLGISVALSTVLVGVIFLWTKSEVPDFNELKQPIDDRGAAISIMNASGESMIESDPVCQHRPEPHDFEITYISGRSGDQKCQSQSPLLTRWSNPIQHLKNGLAESLRLNINYRFFRKPMLASMVNWVRYCVVKNSILVNWHNGVVS